MNSVVYASGSVTLNQLFKNAGFSENMIHKVYQGDDCQRSNPNSGTYVTESKKILARMKRCSKILDQYKCVVESGRYGKSEAPIVGYVNIAYGLDKAYTFFFE